MAEVMTSDSKGFLARRLLLSRVQRAVGKVGVHPSAPIDVTSCRKRLKTKAVSLFQNGAFLPSFGDGQHIGAKGKRLGKPARMQRTCQEALELQLVHLSKYSFEKSS
jgi:hypothetical protein